MIPSNTGKIYLTYPFHLAIYKSFQMYAVVKLRNVKLRYIVIKDNGAIHSILPIIVRKKAKNIGFAGEWAGAGYNDFIGGNKTDIIRTVEYLKNRYSGYRLEFRDINCDSQINKTFQTKVQRLCYSIPITNGYDEWLSSLKSKTRANVRRVYRRVENESFDAQFHIAENLPEKDIRRITGLYYDHIDAIHNNPNKRFLTKIKSIVRRYYKFTPVFLGINSIDRCKVAYTTHNNEIVAFHIFYEEENGIILPKCAYDSKWARYEIGSFNLLELIKAYSTESDNIDLSRGFHAYKSWYGGQPYQNYCLEL